jgi:hypothetical protein
MLWMNPPFDLFEKVLNKIVEDEAHVVLILPSWKKKVLCPCPELESQGNCVSSGVQIFERVGKRTKGLRWGVHAMLLCGHQSRCDASSSSSRPSPRLERPVRRGHGVEWRMRRGPARPVCGGRCPPDDISVVSGGESGDMLDQETPEMLYCTIYPSGG